MMFGTHKNVDVHVDLEWQAGQIFLGGNKLFRDPLSYPTMTLACYQ